MDIKTFCSYLGLLCVSLLMVSFAIIWDEISKPPEKGNFPPPSKTNWRPVGIRTASKKALLNFSISPLPNAFTTMHVGITNDDSIWTVGAPMFELDWVAETDFFVAEGPTIDQQGNLYFSPLDPQHEDVSLIALDGSDGSRRWSLPGAGPEYGAPLILNDPDDTDSETVSQIIYHCTRTDAWAIRTNGSIIWHVKTGLQKDTSNLRHNHMWGMNYISNKDAVVGLSLDGIVFLLDRRTGKLQGPHFHLPCSPAKPSKATRPGAWVERLGNSETDKKFGKLKTGKSIFSSIVEIIFGGGACVSNYFATDPLTGRIYIAATAHDEEDGTVDGESEDGALYMLDVENIPSAETDTNTLCNHNQNADTVSTEKCDSGISSLKLFVRNSATFKGGTGSTPTLSADGEIMYVSDDQNHVIALDAANLKEIWSVDVGEQVAASIAVSHDNREIYAVTRTDVIKIEESPDRVSAKIIWRADLSTAFPDHGAWGTFSQDNENRYGKSVVNALTPTITANGIAVSAGAVVNVKKAQLMMAVGVGLLDRETGKLRYFAQGREESISVMVLGPDGSYFTACSPVRRAVSRALWGDKLKPLVGGITKYKPIRHDLLIRDACCAGAHRASNAAKYIYPLRPDLTAMDGIINHYSAGIAESSQVLALIKQSKDTIAMIMTDDNQINQWKTSGLDIDHISNLLTEANNILNNYAVRNGEVQKNITSLSDLRTLADSLTEALHQAADRLNQICSIFPDSGGDVLTG